MLRRRGTEPLHPLPTVNLNLQDSLEGHNLTPTFTRATVATVKDFEGLVREVKSGEARFEGARRVENLITASEDMTNGAYSTENGTHTVAAGSVTFDGTANGGILQAVTITDDGSGASGRTFRFRVEISTSGTPSSDAALQIGIKGDAITAATVDIGSDVSSTAQTFSVVASTDAAGTAVTPHVTCDDAIAVNISKWQLEEVTGQSNQNPSEYVSTGVESSPFHGANVDGVQYFRNKNGNTVSSGVVTEAQGDAIAASDSNADADGPYGYLSEEARTNIALHSTPGDLGTTWAYERATATANYAVGPSGRKTAVRFLDDSGTGSNTVEIFQSLTITSATDTTFAFDLKEDQLSWAVLKTSGYDAGGNGSSFFDLSSGVVGTKSANHSASGIKSLGNGWYRCWIVFQSTTDVAGFVHVGLADADNDATVDRDGTSSILIANAQVEAGAFPTSYIPTTSSSVARNADVLTYPVAVDPPLTLYSEHVIATVNSGSTLRLLALHDGSSDNRVATRLHTDGGQRALVEAANVLTADINDGSTPSDNTLFSAAIAAATNDVEMYQDGASDGTPDTSAAMPTGITTLNVGQVAGGSTGQPNGTFREVKVFTRRLNDTQGASL